MNDYEEAYAKILRKMRVKAASAEIKKQSNGIGLHLEDSKIIERNTAVRPQDIKLNSIANIGARINKMRDDYMTGTPHHGAEIMDANGLVSTTTKLKGP